VNDCESQNLANKSQSFTSGAVASGGLSAAAEFLVSLRYQTTSELQTGVGQYQLFDSTISIMKKYCDTPWCRVLLAAQELHGG